MEALLECNAATAVYGLQLTPALARALLDTRSGALRKTGRVELGGGTGGISPPQRSPAGG